MYADIESTFSLRDSATPSVTHSQIVLRLRGWRCAAHCPQFSFVKLQEIGKLSIPYPPRRYDVLTRNFQAPHLTRHGAG